MVVPLVGPWSFIDREVCAVWGSALTLGPSTLGFAPESAAGLPVAESRTYSYRWDPTLLGVVVAELFRILRVRRSGWGYRTGSFYRRSTLLMR